jgi:cell division protein FtsL
MIKPGQLMALTGLWLLVMVSALGVIHATHRARLATQELEKLRHEAADLHAESGQLMLERSSLAAYARVEQLALKKLEMTVPQIDQVVIVKP